MIADQVNVGNINYKKVNEMIKWCNVNIGKMSIWKDSVNEHNVWTTDRLFDETVFYFAHEQDATLFRLKWT